MGVRHADNTGPTSGARKLSATDAEALDPELLALCAPPQTQRITALTLMAIAMFCALGLLISLRNDIRYALSRAEPVQLAEARSIVPTQLVSNTYVRIAGTPTIGRNVGFSRGLGTHYRVFPLAGQRTLYVQVRDSGGESFVRTTYSGRLITFDELGSRYRELARVMQRDASLPVTEAAFLLLADEPPMAYVWTLLVALAAIAFMLLDVYLIVRWFRPLKWAAIAPNQSA